MKRVGIVVVWVVLVLAGASSGARAQDLSFTWDGTVVLVDPNMSGSIHGDTVAGLTSFSGFFVYPDVCDFGCIVESFGPDETNYVFAGGFGGLSGGGGVSLGVESSVNIVNDQIVDQESVDLGALLGLTLTLGETTDVWSVASETAGEFTPSFVDWNLEYVYSTSDPFSTTDYVATPPPNPDLILFAINQDDGVVFFALGGVDTVVPEPGLGLMMALGSLGLARRPRSRAGRSDSTRSMEPDHAA